MKDWGEKVGELIIVKKKNNYKKLYTVLSCLGVFTVCRVETECDGTRAETRFGLPAKRTRPFISAGVSVQSAAGSRGVRISGSNAG